MFNMHVTAWQIFFVKKIFKAKMSNQMNRPDPTRYKKTKLIVQWKDVLTLLNNSEDSVDVCTFEM